MMKDTLTMHHANARRPARGARALVAATCGLAAALMAWPAAGQGAAPAASPAPASMPVTSNGHSVTPVIVGGDAVSPVVRHEAASSPRADVAEARAAMGEHAAPELPYAAAVGDATRSLLAWQRSGQIASPVARPLQGEIAQRSRERYLKSFEREIPEHFQSSVSQKSNSR